VAVAAIGVAASPDPSLFEDQVPPWQVAKFYATAMPRSVAEPAGLPYWVPDDQVTTEIDGTAHLAAKTAALRAHATQCVVDGDRFALSDGRWQPVLGREFYTLLAGPSRGGAAWEDDLFAGLGDF
jgi:N-acetyl-1-D-myo-inositol-2-amino-2-deoxy-alpha-D-glucopyranoside deacetylase